MKAFLLFAAFAVVVAGSVALAAPKEVRLWPGRAPGETMALPAEGDTTSPTGDLIAGKRVIRLGNVSDPTISFYSPAPAKNTGAAVIVCPGGGYSILAMDLEGTEVCEWLNSIGVTAVLLKYRVPAREGLPRHAPALQDVQRAFGLVRAQASKLGIDPKRVGVLGFSAGGHLSAMLSNHHDVRSYPRVDEADDVSCRPDFAVLIYPGGLNERDQPLKLNADVTPVAQKTPPTFIAMTEDDRVENAIAYYAGLKTANVPAEMHLYPKGGHGYGLRRTELPVTSWPERVHDWMKSSGWLSPGKP